MPENKQKATIKNLDNNDVVKCQFNPSEYTITKRNRWKQTAGKGRNVPSFEFSGGQPASLKMKLFFDTSSDGTDVREHTKKLWGMMKVKQKGDSEQAEPPQCQFWWGETWNFTAVVSNITQKFTMFLSDGTPIRATLDVAFEQVKDEDEYAFQNPTSRSEPRRTRRVRPGDRLDLIAYEEYGDAGRWIELAEVNELDDPLLLKPGLILKIPIT